ncbi:MAG: DUF1840 domain-containing protein [Burkholderiales bacterium]|nr:DUF1840 domain-containing protein [Burkholderiales bacterium]
MIVRFDSKVGTFVMFGDVAVRLLKLMGHSGTVPSALLAADVAAALAKLRAGLASPAALAEMQAADAASPDDGRGREPAVPLARRAWPLVDLLERAAKKRCDVGWDVENSPV